jgi:hypothetical protein
VASDTTPDAARPAPPADGYLRARWEQAISEYEVIVTQLAEAIAQGRRLRQAEAELGVTLNEGYPALAQREVLGGAGPEGAVKR